MTNISQEFISDTLEKNYMPYAMSVIISRAIPEIDGFKPSHRKLLYTMYKMGLLSGNRTKSANIVGSTMKLNPHGDGAIYETMVRLTRGNEALLHPLVDSKGNFGKHYSRNMSYAASRYTEAKLDTISHEIFKDINKNVVDFTDNYDGTMKEPVLLPTTFPNILVNPNQGIAVGMASNICSFNLREINAATIAFLKNEKCDISEFITAPDFPTGGSIVYDKVQMDSILETGRGSFKIRAKYRFDKSNSCIEIYEIPYTTCIEAIIDKIVECVKAGKLKEISDIRDESDKTGLKITIDIKKSCDPDQLMQRLYKMTPLQDSFGCNFNVLLNGMPYVLGVKDIIKNWCNFRIECVSRALKYDIKEKSDKLHLLEGLKKILLDVDKAIAIIRGTEEDSMVVPRLMEGFDIDEIQAEYVANIKLRNLNKDYIMKGIGEVDKLKDEIAEMQDILENEKKIKKIIIKELEEISKKFGIDRKSDIIYGDELPEVSETVEIDDYNLKVFLTRDGYFKKISLVSLRGADVQKLKPEDEIIAEIETTNGKDILFFTDKSDVYKSHLYDLPDGCKASMMGEYLPNLLDMADGEQVLFMAVTSDYSGFLLFAFENGKVAKVDMKSYETKTNRKKLTAAFYAKSPAVGMLHFAEDGDFVLESKGGRYLAVNSANIALKSKRDTQGVQVYLSKRDKLVKNLMTVEESGLENLKPYYSEKIPSSGRALKDDDKPFVQIGLFGDEN